MGCPLASNCTKSNKRMVKKMPFGCIFVIVPHASHLHAMNCCLLSLLFFKLLLQLVLQRLDLVKLRFLLGQLLSLENKLFLSFVLLLL